METNSFIISIYWPGVALVILFLIYFIIYFYLRSKQFEHALTLTANWSYIIDEKCSPSPFLVETINKLNPKMLKYIEYRLTKNYKKIINQLTSIELGEFILAHKNIIKNKRKQYYLINIIETIIVDIPVTKLSDMMNEALFATTVSDKVLDADVKIFEFFQTVLSACKKATSHDIEVLISVFNQTFTERFAKITFKEDTLILIQADKIRLINNLEDILKRK